MVLLAGSLVSLLAFLVIILVLKVVGFQLTGPGSRNGREFQNSETSVSLTWE